MIEMRRIDGKADRDAFIRLPGQLAKDDPAWVEPLMLERRQFLDPGHNPFFEHATVVHWLAYADGRPAGRISAVIGRLVPVENGRIQGFFGLIDARRDDVLAELLRTAETWLGEQGASLVRGPFSLSINQTSGLLVKGSDTPPNIMMDHHDPWLGPAVERQGYAKAQDLVAYELDVSNGISAKPRRLVERDWSGLRVRSLDMSRYRDEIKLVTSIFNDAWSDNWGFVPLTEAEIDGMATELKPILDPELVKIAELDGVPAAFVVLLPNINEAIAGLDGRLLPFGWAKLLWRLKVRGVRSGRVPLMGVRRDYSDTLIGKSLPLRLILALEKRALARRIDRLEMSWLLEENWAVRRLIESIGAHHSKTYRIYEKVLE